MKTLKIVLLLFCLFALNELCGQNTSISTPNTTLVLSAPIGGELKYLYYGTKLSQNQADELNNFEQPEFSAYPVYGLDAPRESALAVKHSNGDMTLQMEVVSTNKKKDTNSHTTIINIKDKDYPNNLDVCYNDYNNVDISEMWTDIQHN